jgi:hypothetical protein
MNCGLGDNSPEFPAGCWPSARTPPNEKAWSNTVEAFGVDLKTRAEMVANESTDLFAAVQQMDTTFFYLRSNAESFHGHDARGQQSEREASLFV